MGEAVSSIMTQRNMYITIRSIKKTLGKYIKMMDLYIDLLMLMTFLILFAFSNMKIIALIF